MTGLAQNEMKAKRGMPLLVRSMEGLAVSLRKRHVLGVPLAPAC